MADFDQKRNEYRLNLKINHKTIHRVIIDQHYREKHSESVSDELILELVKELDDRILEPEAERNDYQYFTVEPVFLYQDVNKPFRLILVIYIHDDYLGVINAYRVNRS